MEKYSARTGYLWVKQGYALYRQQAGAMTSLFLIVMFMSLLSGVVPFFGRFIPFLLMPMVNVAFMQGCLLIDNGRRVTPAVLASGLRKPAVLPLLGIGMLHLVAVMVAVSASTLVDDGMFLKVMSRQIPPDSAELQQSNIGGAFLLMAAIYLPATLMASIAAPLVFWQQRSVGKALFFSAYAILRSWGAFAIFILTWVGLTLFITNLVIVLFGQGTLAVTVMFPVLMVLMVIFHCSIYASYRQIFGTPQALFLEKSGS